MGNTLTDETQVLSQFCLKHSQKHPVKTIGGWQRGKVGKKEVQADHFINVIESF